jgi:putative ubiquitin-RnfH superfamily antitoxin RatB of RatAB toxin-antitoxin module
MRVSVAYAVPDKQVWTDLQVQEGCTVLDAINQSKIMARFPDINLDQQKVGIFGKFCKLDAVVKEGDRIEIYRPIIADPKTVKRRDRDDDEDDD